MTTMTQTVTAAQASAIGHQAVETGERENVAKNLLLFFAAPLIGLAYIVAFPLVGAVILLKVALRI